MFEELTPKFQKHAHYKLHEAKEWLTLNDFLGEFIDQSTDYKNIEEMRAKNSLAPEKVLEYLLPLLKSSKLRVGRWHEKGTVKIGESIMKDVAGTPEEIINMIRKEWNTKVGDELAAFEISEFVFALPENPWPKSR